MPSNNGDVLDNGTDSNNEHDVSTTSHCVVAAMIKDTFPTISRKGLTAPLHIPHLYWNCIAQDAALDDRTPVVIPALIDYGSHLVLIHEDTVASLGLKHQMLVKPETIELAMQNNNHCVTLNH